MRQAEIAEFVKSNVVPLPPLNSDLERYRVSAVLNDGILLPCVVIQARRSLVDLAVRRFQETRKSDDPFMGYRAIVSSFVTKGNCVNDYDLRELRLSECAIPLERLREAGGETTMAWTQFYATMSDGKEFCFGTSFLFEFFDMPEGYRASDIVSVRPAPRDTRSDGERIYRERPFFRCYIDDL